MIRRQLATGPRSLTSSCATATSSRWTRRGRGLRRWRWPMAVIAAVGVDGQMCALAAAPAPRRSTWAVAPCCPGSSIRTRTSGRSATNWRRSTCRAAIDRRRAARRSGSERARRPQGEWIEVSGMWHETALAEHRFPTRSELDAVAPDHPVYLPRGTRFFAVANSRRAPTRGYRRAHTRTRRRRVRDATPSSGELTGLLLQPPGVRPGEQAAAAPQAPTTKRRPFGTVVSSSREPA